jgi:ribosomal protein S18 acetylase RimI-like enzyme
VTIRTARPEDAAVLATFGAATFRAAYAGDVPGPALDAFIDATFGVAAQAAELADPDGSCLIAEHDGEVVGYLLSHRRPAPPAVTGARPLALDRLYVATPLRGRGIGRALLDVAGRAAVAGGHDVLWLSVWEANTRAIDVYRWWGFVDVGALDFDLAAVPQIDRLMVLDLRPGAGPG